MIDGCFLKCHGRVLRSWSARRKIIQFDALPLYKKYTDVFLMEDVPEEERKAVARQVADKIIAQLKQQAALRTTVAAEGAHDVSTYTPGAGTRIDRCRDGQQLQFLHRAPRPGVSKAGLGDAHISEAIRLADKVRQVPGPQQLDTAFSLLAQSFGSPGRKALLWLALDFLRGANHGLAALREWVLDLSGFLLALHGDHDDRLSAMPFRWARRSARRPWRDGGRAPGSPIRARRDR
jgi:hypothetical protein